jgi:hypothetical protein
MIERTKISLGTVWEETFAFCKAEAGLLAPLALLGFGLPLVVLGMVLPGHVTTDGHVTPGLWMLWLPVHLFFNLLGTLSMSALTIRPGISVREALAVGLSRLPAALGFALLAWAAFLGIWVIVGIAAGVETSLTGRPGPISLLLMLIAIVLLGWALLRLTPIWAAIVSSRSNGWITLRATLALTRGLAPWMLLVRVIQIVSAFTVMTVLGVPIQAMFELIGRLTGADGFSHLLATLVNCVIAAAIVALWTVYVAKLYRRMETARSGT